MQVFAHCPLRYCLCQQQISFVFPHEIWKSRLQLLLPRCFVFISHDRCCLGHLINALVIFRQRYSLAKIAIVVSFSTQSSHMAEQANRTTWILNADVTRWNMYVICLESYFGSAFMLIALNCFIQTNNMHIYEPPFCVFDHFWGFTSELIVILGDWITWIV